MNEKIKIAFFDMDGTLLNQDAKITQYTKESIEYLSKRGMVFGIASGRPIAEIERKLLGGGIHQYFTVAVGLNGSHVKNLKTGYFEQILSVPAEGVDKIIDLYKDMEDVDIFLSNETDLYVKRMNAWVTLVSNEDHLHVNVTDFEEERKKSWPKVSVYFLAEDKDEVERRYNEEFNFPEAVGMICSSNNMEFTHRATDKGVGVQYMCGMLHIPLNKAVGFGDTGNDLRMFETVGRAYAMKNGTDDAKKTAGHVTDYDNAHDGAVRQLMEHQDMLDLEEEKDA